MNHLEIVYLPPGDLTPYAHNARAHAEKDLSVIKASIRENGFCDPIGVWGDNNLIVEGHGRQLAALELGLESVPCIRLDHLTEAQRREYALTHNKSAELSAWDFAELEAELSELEMDFDMGEFGFADDEAPSLMDAMAEDFGVAGEAKAMGTVTLTFDSQEDAEEVKSYVRKNDQAGVILAVLNYVRGYDA